MDKPEYWLKDDFLPEQTAKSLLTQLIKDIDWRQETISMFGKTINMPRLQAFMGDGGIEYSYSKLTMTAEAWHPELIKLKGKIEDLTGNTFNSALINYYRNGQDSMSWHQDNEHELGKKPIIASLSLGATRKFVLRHIESREKHELQLHSGSLLWMGPTLQSAWQHSLPKSKVIEEPRINITFRQIKY